MQGEPVASLVSDPVEALRERLRKAAAIERANGVLRWDQEVVMPPGGTPARARERAELSRLAHEAWTADAMRDAIEAADREASTRDERAIVREAVRKHQRLVRVPDDVVEALAEATSRAHAYWVEAKREDDFESFAPVLEEIVQLRRQYAGSIAPDRSPYAVLFEDHEPWLDWTQAREHLEALVEGLAPLVDQAPETPDADAGALEGPWPTGVQREVFEELLEELGYDYDRGRIDESEHPFTTGNPHDARVTTRLHEDDLLSGLTSTVHEFGHALYTQNLPREHLGTPLGEDRNLVVHEANARLWENHVARSSGFWRWLAPTLEDAFDREIDPFEAWRTANRIQPGPIRVDADEVTYHLHIAVRVGIEERLVEGELSVDEVPKAWNDRMEALVGVRPDNDREGVLQDVHWSHGSIGYFPTYSLGSMLAAQLAEAIEADAGPIAPMAHEGRFSPIRDWLAEHVHRHGQRFTTGGLVEHATGGELSPQPLIDYAEEKVDRVAAGG